MGQASLSALQCTNEPIRCYIKNRNRRNGKNIVVAIVIVRIIRTTFVVLGICRLGLLFFNGKDVRPSGLRLEYEFKGWGVRWLLSPWIEASWVLRVRESEANKLYSFRCTVDTHMYI